MDRKVLLVGWDAADWKVIHPLMDAGEMPNLAGLVENGVCGNLATLKPVLSPMLWTSIATGKRAYQHGICGFTEPNPDTQRPQPISVLSRKCKALWNMLQQRDLRSHVVGWWPSHPAEPISGVMVSNRYEKAGDQGPGEWKMPPGTIHPEAWSERLAAVRVHPGELSRNHLEPFIPKIASIDPEEDGRVTAVASCLAECASLQAAATALIETEPWDFMAVYFDAIDHVSHGFMKYHPPRQEWIPEEDYETYQHVVRSMYRFHDIMLGALIQQAGEDTTVMIVSDHGFHPDHLRPHHIPHVPAGPATEHRPYGVFVLKGPGIRADERVTGATLLDVTPTILQLFGLPVARDMDGKVIATAFESPPEIDWIDSWEDVEGESGEHGPDARIDPVEAHEALNQLVALGYVDAPPEDGQAALDQTSRELTFNRSLSLIDGNRAGDAAPILARLWERWPDQSRFGVELFSCQLALDRPGEARSTLQTLVERKQKRTAEARRELRKVEQQLGDKSPEELPKEQQRSLRGLAQAASTNRHAFAYMSARVLQAEGHPEDALAALDDAEDAPVTSQPSLFLLRGQLLVQLERWTEAETCFQDLLAIDPVHAGAELGLASCHLGRGQVREAAESARTSLGLLFHNPKAHYIHGVALQRLGDTDTAILALETAVSQNPNLVEGHQLLARIFDGPRTEPERAEQHRTHAAAAQARIEASRAATTTTEGDASAAASPLPRTHVPTSSPRFEDPASVVTIVSGLPRSGTSMMMQMLQAGGHPIFSDDHRAADEHNPKGYLESVKARGLRDDATWLPEAKGTAVKVIAQLLRHLDPKLNYRILFMERDIDEVIQSQGRLIADTDRAGAQLNAADLARVFAADVAHAQALATEGPNIQALGVDYHEAVQAPREVAERVAAFLDSGLDVDAMTAAVDPSLHRVRSEGV